MKIALLGHSSFALESALAFDYLEAQITWFLDEILIDHYFNYLPRWNEVTSDLGLEILTEKPDGLDFLKSDFSWKSWTENYWNPLLSYLSSRQNLKKYNVTSITKRYLAPVEKIEGRTRFHDLFRVIYELNPEEFINQQKETNPATYQRLSEEFLRSLQASLEMYEDFDLVFDFRSYLKPNSISSTGRALGEFKVRSDKVHIGLDSLNFSPKEASRDLAIIGSHEYAATVLIKLKDWLKDPRNNLFIISHESDPFHEFLLHAQDSLKKEVESIFSFMNQQFLEEKEKFLEQLRDWQNLDEFIQVKKPRPAEPIPRLVFFSAHNVTAIDQLIDKKRIFITLEIPDWRKGIKQPENNFLDLKTIGIDEVVVCMGLDQDRVVHLAADELGYFRFCPKKLLYKHAKRDNDEALEKIKTQVFELFSPNTSD